MKAIRELEQMGYTFATDGDELRATCDGDQSDAGKVRTLLGYVKRHKGEALAYLRKRKQLEARLEHGLEVLQAATGCSDSEAERLLSHWDVVNLEYDAAVQNDKTELDAT